MKINYDENCDFGGAFEGAYIEYNARGTIYHCSVLQPYGIIHWWNRIYETKYKIVAIKNFDAKKLFKWAGIDDYPECLQGNLSHTRKI